MKKILFILLLLVLSLGVAYAQQDFRVSIHPQNSLVCVLVDTPIDHLTYRFCKGNRAVYEAHCPVSATFVWQVEGGEIVANETSGNQCTVQWGDGDGGSLYVQATDSDGSVCSGSISVVLIDKPEIGLITMPNYILDREDHVEDNLRHLYVCAGDSITFIDNSHSDGTPIASCSWICDDGSSTSITNSATFSMRPMNSGSFDVIHRVYNACGCYAEETIMVKVGDECPAEFSCYGAVCAETDATYELTSPTCDDYLWSAEGGVVMSGQHSPIVRVHWGSPASGYGMLFLNGDGCNCDCESRKSIRVPVISDQAQLNGPEVVCKYDRVSYSLPLWGATEYSWTVTPSNNAIAYPSANGLDVVFTQTGEYTIKATFECRFLNCGPFEIERQIVVKEPLSVTGPDNVCEDAQALFQTNATSSSEWSISINGTQVYQADAVSLSYSFPEPGVYTVTAVNDDYCRSESLLVTVHPTPPAPLQVSGPLKVCPGDAGDYSAIALSSEYYLLWEWEDDNEATQSVSGEDVTIQFGDRVGPVSAFQVRRDNGCRSEAVTIQVSALTPSPWPYGSLSKMCYSDTLVPLLLEDQSRYGVLYTWTVEPAYLISIQDNHLTPHPVLVANYPVDGNPHQANVILNRKMCNVEYYDTLRVLVGDIDAPTISAPNIICQHIRADINISNFSNMDQDLSYWVVDNDNNNVVPCSSPLVFDVAGSHQVQLHFVSRGGCEAVSNVLQVEVRAFPSLSIEQNEQNTLCVRGGENDPSLSYLWSTGETSPCISYTPHSELQTCLVTSTNGCSMRITQRGENSHDCQSGNVEIQHSCYNYLLPAFQGHDVYPVTVLIRQPGFPDYTCKLRSSAQSILIPHAGPYTLTFRWQDENRCYSATISGTQELPILSYSVDYDCHNRIIVSVTDNMAAPQRHVTILNSQDQTIRDMNLNNASSVRCTVETDGTYYVQIWANDCMAEFPVDFHSAPSLLAQQSIPSTMCDNTPYTFSANARGHNLSYRWDFDDGSFFPGNGIDHQYHYNETVNDINSNNKTVSLTITDDNGCQASRNFNINVVRNPIAGIIEWNPIPCPGPPVTLTCHNSSTLTNYTLDYTWHPDIESSTNIAEVYKTGNYFVDLLGLSDGCRNQAVTNASYPNSIDAYISCEDSYCVGDVVTAFGDMGDGYLYHWSISPAISLPDASSPNISFPVLNDIVQEGTDYTLTLTVSNLSNTCSTSVSKPIEVNPTPTAPSISFGLNSCISDGAVNLNSDLSIPLIWGNGDYGLNANYFTSGTATAFYFDPASGCKSALGTINIPPAPHFDGLLTGCYYLCEEFFPYKLPLFTLGKTGNFDWSWIEHGSSIEAGSFPPPTLPEYLSLPHEDSYSLEVFYGNGCVAQSPEFSIDAIPCKGNDSPHIQSFGNLQFNLLQKNCKVDGCEIMFELSLEVCNTSEDIIDIDDIQSSSNFNLFSPLSIYLYPGDCETIDLEVIVDPSSSGVYTFVFMSGGSTVETYSIALNDWMTCLDIGVCEEPMDSMLTINSNLGKINQCVFFDFHFSPQGSGVVLYAICDDGQIIDAQAIAPEYWGLLMMDYGRLTQMAHNRERICFHLICCHDDKLCQMDVCWDAVSLLEQAIRNLKTKGTQIVDSEGSDSIGETWGKIALSPNPASSMVRVIDARSGDLMPNITEIYIFSMQGKKMLSLPNTSQFDISHLVTGTYIVKLVSKTDAVEYLKLVKK